MFEILNVVKRLPRIYSPAKNVRRLCFSSLRSCHLLARHTSSGYGTKKHGYDNLLELTHRCQVGVKLNKTKNSLVMRRISLNTSYILQF